MTEPIYSPGLEGVIAGETAVSTIEGGLRYRGYAVEDLAERATFEETAYLLIHGDLPDSSQLKSFRQRLDDVAKLPDPLLQTLRSVPRSAPLMDVMRTGASMLAHWDADIHLNDHDANVRKAERLVSQLPVVMAAAHRMRQGLEPVAAKPGLSIAENILWMIRGEMPSSQAAAIMDDSLIMYAEHEFNASTFAARVVASTLADLHSGIVAGIGALKGPLHGGANERVLEVLQSVGSPHKAESWVQEAFSRKEKIMGFGHRVYKEGDPRARYLKPFCEQLAKETHNEQLDETAAIIERKVWEEKRIPPNVDWPTARLYHYLGLAVELYTPLFVVARVTGWSAHIIEQLDNNRIIRPRSRYTGSAPRRYG